MYPNLNAEMARQNLKSADIAKAMGVCQKTGWNKLTGATPITLMETVAVRNKHFPGWNLEKLFLKGQKGDNDG